MSLESVQKEFMERVAPILMQLETKEAMEVDCIIRSFFQNYAYHSYEAGWKDCYLQIAMATPSPFRLSDVYAAPWAASREEFIKTHVPRWGTIT